MVPQPPTSLISILSSLRMTGRRPTLYDEDTYDELGSDPKTNIPLMTVLAAGARFAADGATPLHVPVPPAPPPALPLAARASLQLPCGPTLLALNAEVAIIPRKFLSVVAPPPPPGCTGMDGDAGAWLDAKLTMLDFRGREGKDGAAREEDVWPGWGLEEVEAKEGWE